MTTNRDFVYQIHLFDRLTDIDDRIAVLENAFNISIKKKINYPVEIHFNMPHGDPKITTDHTDGDKLLAIGRYIKVINRDGNTEAEGLIISPLDLTQSPVQVTAVGRDILLSYVITPWEHDLTGAPIDILRNLLYRYDFRRVNEPTEFNNGTYDTTELLTNITGDPDAGDEDCGVTLEAKTEDPVGEGITFETEGWWTSPVLDFDSTLGSDPLTGWWKLRWKQITGGDTTIGWQSRTGDVAVPDGTWSAWSSELPVDPNFYFDEQTVVGFSISSPTARYIQVKFHLETTNEDFSPILIAVEVVGQYGGPISEGSGFATLPGDTIYYKPSYENHLTIIRDILEDLEFEFEINSSGEIDIAAQLGSDLTSQYLLEENRHVNVLEYEEDDSEIQNFLFALGSGNGLNQLFSFRVGSTSVGTYGRRGGKFEDQVQTSLTDLDTEATTFLTTYGAPKRHIRLQVVETNDGTKDFRLGDEILFASIGREITPVTLRITGEERRLTEDGEEIFLDLSNRRRFFTELYLREHEITKTQANISIKHFATNFLWSDWIATADEGWNTATLPLGFTPDSGVIQPIAYIEETTGSILASGFLADARIRDLVNGKMVYEYRKTSITANRIRLLLLWTAWSDKI